jgi:hypothetical protein
MTEPKPHYVLEIVHVTTQYLDGAITDKELVHKIVTILLTYNLIDEKGRATE